MYVILIPDFKFLDPKICLKYIGKLVSSRHLAPCLIKSKLRNI